MGAKRQWDKSIFQRYEVVASPSQLTNLLDCTRKWWFRSVLRLPEIEDQQKFVFGNVLHEVVQRWLQADDTGRDLKTGKTIEIYPEGWSEGLSPKDAALVKILVDKAISDGLLRRMPGREIEREFEIEVIPGVAMIGALDVCSPEGVDDHKTTKSTKYIMSPDALASDPKMLAYAKVWLDWFPDRDSVKLRLNYIVKDPEAPETRAVEAILKKPDVEEYWQKTIVPAAESMLRLKRAKIPAEKWATITPPQDTGVCRKYGGCPRAKICARVQSVKTHKEQIDRINGKKTEPKTKEPSTPDRTVSFLNKNKKITPPPAPAVPDPAPLIAAANAARAAANAPAPEPEPAQQTVCAPPWHTPGCNACAKTPGVNSKGEPCKACDRVSERQGRPTSSQFTYGLDETGSFFWASKETTESAPEADPEAGSTPVIAEPKAKKTKTKEAKPKPKEVPEPVVEETAGEPVVEEVEHPRESALEPIRLEVEQAPGFRLFINAIPLDEPYVELSDILHQEGKDLAEALGRPSFYDLDAFKRRDALASKIDVVVHEQLEGKNVVALGNSQDLKAYLDAIRPFASSVVVGVF